MYIISEVSYISVPICSFYLQVLSELQSGSSLHQHAQHINDSLYSILSVDSVLQTLVSQLNNTLMDLKHSCIKIINSTVDGPSLFSECVGLLERNMTNLFPRTRHDVISFGGVEGEQSLLSLLVELLSQVDDFNLRAVDIDAFHVYLDTNLVMSSSQYMYIIELHSFMYQYVHHCPNEHMCLSFGDLHGYYSSSCLFRSSTYYYVKSLSFSCIRSHTQTTYLNNSIKTVSDQHLGTNSNFNQSLVAFLSDTVHFYSSSLTFGLPQSQEQLEGFLGPQFLSNWEVFRYACTLTFALIVLLLGGCLLVAMGRGLLDLLVIYNGGDDLTHSEGAHQAGTMLKKCVLTIL